MRVPSKTADEFDRAVAAYVRATAGARQIKASTIAERAGLNRDTFYRYWRGERTIRLSDLRAILNVLDVSLAEAEGEITRLYESGDYAAE